MQVDCEQLLAGFHEFYPVRAQALCEQLKKLNRTKALEEWRERQLLNFIGLLMQNAEDLEAGHGQRRITKIAWATRNLLEVSIWVAFCNLSDTHATRFRDDTARDFLGFSRATQALFTETEGVPNATIEESEKRLMEFGQQVLGLPNLDDDFKKVSDAAKELGMQKTFVAHNKILSKFAHPTSIAMQSVGAVEADAPLRELFLTDGVLSAIGSLTVIREQIANYFAEEVINFA